MSYKVFALKWRPKNFDEIISQNHVTNTLKSAIKANRLAHAYLFAGPRGVGKTSTARILSKALNCKNGPTLNPCQECSACKEISRGNSLDVIEIDGASNRGIDEIRTLRENVKFAPTHGDFKIYIIDEVHMLTEPAFNALLKTLEEPPPYVKFIFATTRPDKIPLTILSRCQRFDFRRIPAMDIVAQLEKIIAVEKIKIDREVLFAIARASDGALRDAESVLDQLNSISEGKIILKDVVSVLGIVEQEALFEITEKIIRKDASGALKVFNQLIDSGKDSGIFLMNLVEHFRNLMVARITGADPKLIDLPEEFRQRLLKESQAFTLSELFSIFNLLVNTQETSKRLESMRIPLEIALVKLSHDKKDAQAQATPAPKEPPRKIDPPSGISPFAKSKTPEKKPHAQEKPHTQEKPHAQEKPLPVKSKPKPIQAISLDDIRGVWRSIIDNIAKVKMSVATYLNEGMLMNLDGDTLTIAFPEEYSLHKESLEVRENKQMIEKTVSDLSNSQLRINFILSEEVVRKEAEDDSLLRSTLDMFNGRVVRKE